MISIAEIVEIGENLNSIHELLQNLFRCGVVEIWESEDGRDHFIGNVKADDYFTIDKKTFDYLKAKYGHFQEHKWTW